MKKILAKVNTLFLNQTSSWNRSSHFFTNLVQLLTSTCIPNINCYIICNLRRSRWKRERERDRREQKETIFRGHPLFEFEFKYKRRARFKDRVNDSQSLRDHFSICLETLFIYSRRNIRKLERKRERDRTKNWL